MMINELTLNCSFELTFDKTGLAVGIDSDIDLTKEEIHEIEKILVKSFLNQIKANKEFSKAFIDSLKIGEVKKQVIMNGGNENVRN